jgi:hypothetical protein
VDVWAAGLQLPSIADVDLGETSSSSEEEEGGVAPGFNVDKALEAQVARLSSSSSSSSMPPEQLAIRADALTDFNVPEALNPGGLGGLARAVLAASPRVMLPRPRHSPLPAAVAAALCSWCVGQDRECRFHPKRYSYSCATQYLSLLVMHGPTRPTL